jgi:NhaP-type Na+/H+ or K+/H+ antiporter
MTALDLMLYAACAAGVLAGAAILFVGGWLIQYLTAWDDAEREKDA